MEEKTQNNLSQPNSQYWTVTRCLSVGAGLLLLVGGLYFFINIDIDQVIDKVLPRCQEWSPVGRVLCPDASFLAGLIVMTALSLLGVPVIPALLAGGTSWLIIGKLLNKH
ncbi:MAG: hypothetical protein ACRCU2_33375 [Planktothrix sp.]